jgi:AcrR family transcriptional regulator
VPRAEAREQAILDAALVLAMEVGYDRLSMDALAERA